MNGERKADNTRYYALINLNATSFLSFIRYDLRLMHFSDFIYLWANYESNTYKNINASDSMFERNLKYLLII